MRTSLGKRYSIIISGVLVAIVGLLAALYLTEFRTTSEHLRQLSANSLRDNLMVQIRQRGEALNAVLVQRLVNPLYRLDMLRIYQLMRETADLPDVVYLYLADTDGRIIHDGTRLIAAYGQPVDTVVNAVAIPPQQVLQVRSAVSLAEADLGSVILGMSLTPVIEQTAAIDESLGQALGEHQSLAVRSLLLYSLLMLLVGIALALTISRRFARPVRQLAQFAVGVGEGRHDKPPYLDRHDEIGLLASSLNEMSDNLERSIGESEFLAYHDSLTRLPNRVQLKRLLTGAIQSAQASGESMALLFMDLDDFKNVNDTLGHEAGDEFLQALALRLSRWITNPPQDMAHRPALSDATLARLGGDEFTLVLRNAGHSDAAEAVAKGVLEVMREPFLIHGEQVVVGASIGITLCPDHGDDISRLLRNADTAMYQAKGRGRNNYCIYQPAMEDARHRGRPA